MSERRAGAYASWVDALVAVPALLAGLSVLWPGPALSRDLDERASAALAAAGLPGVGVEVTGRDVVLLDVPADRVAAATAVVRSVSGVRAVEAPAAARRPVPSPSTPAAPEPAASGDRVAVAGPILFTADSAELTGPATEAVAEVAGLLRARPGTAIEVVGHAADLPGPAERALALSQERAEVVARALADAGVPPSRITTRGAGDARPLATLEASRRVEIVADPG